MKDLNYYRERTGSLVIENERLKGQLAEAERKIIELASSRLDAQRGRVSRARHPVENWLDI